MTKITTEQFNKAMVDIREAYAEFYNKLAENPAAFTTPKPQPIVQQYAEARLLDMIQESEDKGIFYVFTESDIDMARAQMEKQRPMFSELPEWLYDIHKPVAWNVSLHDAARSIIHSEKVVKYEDLKNKDATLGQIINKLSDTVFNVIRTQLAPELVPDSFSEYRHLALTNVFFTETNAARMQVIPYRTLKAYIHYNMMLFNQNSKDFHESVTWHMQHNVHNRQRVNQNNIQGIAYNFRKKG